jgi:peptide/nickel transport system substrate-binding protein
MTLRRWLPAAIIVASASLLLAACGGRGRSTTSNSATPGSASAKAATGGTASFAEVPGDQPNFIFPIDPVAFQTVANSSDFQALMWRPLVWEGAGSGPGIDRTKSLFSSLRYSSNSKTVMVTLKPYRWSDGRPVTSRDVQFDFNLLKANKEKWGGYTPGELPDNITRFKIINSHTFQLQLNQSYSQRWFTNNQLPALLPLPQHAWDKTSASGKVGNYDLSTSGARRVFNFLVGQGKIVSTFATNPLWRVVDGPWRLAGFTSNGKATFVPNKRYSGPDKAHLSRFIELPFTSDTAEFNVLRSGGAITVGSLPAQDYKEQPALKAEGYALEPWIISTIWYIIPNLTNPQVGNVLSQLYIRQALEQVIPQQLIIKRLFHGFAYREDGPVPLKPKSNLISPYEHGIPYRFSITDAIHLLRSHGWAVRPNGTDICERGGAGPGHCGAGVPTGKRLSLNLLYATGNQGMTLETQEIQSEASKAGIRISLSSGPVNTVFGDVAPCPKTCNWQLGFYGSLTYPSGLPTGDGLWTKGGALNAGSWYTPETQRLINATLHSNGLKVFYAYEDYIAKELPWIWVVDVDGSLAEVKSDLHGFTENEYYSITPEDWYYAS